MCRAVESRQIVHRNMRLIPTANKKRSKKKTNRHKPTQNIATRTQFIGFCPKWYYFLIESKCNGAHKETPKNVLLSFLHSFFCKFSAEVQQKRKKFRQQKNEKINAKYKYEKKSCILWITGIMDEVNGKWMRERIFCTAQMYNADFVFSSVSIAIFQR